MQGYIYKTQTLEIVAVITGESNKLIEAMAEDLNYMGVDEYWLSYTDSSLAHTNYTEHHKPECFVVSRFY